MKKIFIVFILSESSSFVTSEYYEIAEGAYYRAEIPNGDLENGGKYLLSVEDGKEWGMIEGMCTPDKNYPFYGATIIKKELS